jgi:hypothetical protein
MPYDVLLKTDNVEVTRSERGAISFSYNDPIKVMHDLFNRIKKLESKLEVAKSNPDEAVAKLEAKVKSLDNSVCEEIDNRDHWEERATKLADAVGDHFSESVGEHSSGNCPINNAHELLNQIGSTDKELISPESIQSIIDYIDEGEPNLKVLKSELGELIERYNGTYLEKIDTIV